MHRRSNDLAPRGLRHTFADHTRESFQHPRWCFVTQDVYGRDVDRGLSVDAFAAGQVAQFDNPEAIAGALYDYQAYAAAGQQQLTFFQVPQGQGVTIFGGGGAKTYEDTNMEIGGMLTAGMAFRVRAIEIVFVSGVQPANDFVSGVAPVAKVNLAANDQWTAYKRGWLEFSVLNKVYNRDAPLSMYNPRSALSLQAAAAITTDVAAQNEQFMATNMIPVGAPYIITPITLTANLKFKVQIQWTQAVALPSTVAGIIGTRLVGEFLRAAQ